MPWQGTSPNQTFTRTDGTRVGSTTWTQADAAGVKIVANGHDTHDSDISDGVSACLKKDGGNAATANLQMGGFTLTNLGAATARSHPTRYSDVQDNKPQYVTGVGGTADAITLSPSVAITGYTAGQRFSFIAAATNTGAVTVNVSGQGVKDLTGRDAAFTALPGSTIIVGVMQDIEYDGTRFQYMGSVAAGGTPTTTLTGAVTGSGAGSVATTLADDIVTNAKLANMTNGTYKMGSAGDPIDATSTQATAGLNTFTSALKGLVSASGGGTTNFARADGTWAVPPGTVTTVAVTGCTPIAGQYLASCSASFAGSTWTLAFTQATDVGSGGGGGACFPAGSLVRMADGSERAIETIEPGDLLWSPTGPATVDHLHAVTLGWRKYWRMADDSLFFSDEHPLVVERDGDYRLWSMNIDMLMQEAERGEIPGIEDWDWMFEGAAGKSEAFVTLSGLNHTCPVRSRTGAHSKLPLYMPFMTNNELIAVNGYVVGGNIGPGCDYKSIDWKGL